ncbi:MAG: adenylyltransferase/cytidyltransferase family protein [Eubacterium sp.]|nr:adenylyltransferase/cytidyltransferase family protein [Eubacterium sp.]
MKHYKTGYIAGVFDLFHIGHLNVIRRASAHCEELIVGVLVDELVEFYKKEPPFIPFEERIDIVGSLSYVSRAVPVTVENIDKMTAWRRYHFDVLFSGDDYAGHPGWMADKENLERVGATIEFFPYTKSTCSTKLKAMIEAKMNGQNTVEIVSRTYGSEQNDADPRMKG